MGTIRESNDPEEKFLSSILGLSLVDLPEKSNILLDDITKQVLIRRSVNTPVGPGETVDHYSFSEYEIMVESARRGVRAGRKLINELLGI